MTHPLSIGGQLLVVGGELQVAGVLIPVEFVSLQDRQVTSSNIVLTLTSSRISGSTLIALIKDGQGEVPSGITDSKGNTWIIDASSGVGGSATATIAHCNMATQLVTGDEITVSLPVSRASHVAIYEYSGAPHPLEVDVTATGTSGSTGTLVAPATTTEDFVIIACASGGLTTTLACDIGTFRGPSRSTSNLIELYDILDVPAGTVHTMHWSGGATNIAMVYVAYKR